MPGICSLIFDFDGLILETESAYFSSWQTAFRSQGHDYTLLDYHGIVGSAESPLALFEARCGPGDFSAIHEQRRRHHRALIAALGVQPGVVELLDQAGARGFRIAIASSSPRAWVRELLQTHGLLDRFETIVCFEDVARVKPEPDLYLEALRRLGVAAHEAIAFEDSHNGSLAAKRAGLWCAAVPTPITETQDFSHVDVRLKTLAGLDLEKLLARFR
jgi:putative hydrolase of the HAD superfamily